MPGSRKRSSYSSYGKGKGARSSRKKGRFGSSASRGPRRMLNARTGGFRGIENKFVDYSLAGGEVLNTVAGSLHDPSQGCLNAISQGDGENQRDGRKCTLTSIYIRGDIQLSSRDEATQPPTPQCVRIALVWDKQANAAQTNPTDVFEVTALNIVPHNFRNLQNTTRFQVLHDETVVVDFAAGATGSVLGNADWVGGKSFFKIYKKLNIPVLFNNSTADISTITNNALHLLCWTEIEDRVLLTYNSRVRFMG